MSYSVRRDSDKVVYRTWEARENEGDRLRIAVLKLDHVGDFWMALAPLRELRKRFSKAHITLIVGSWNLETARTFLLADEYVSFDFFKVNPRIGKKHRDLGQIREQLKGSFDLAIDMRVPDETREVLLAIDARHRAAIADRCIHPKIDLAILPGKIKLRRNILYKLLQKASLSGLIPRNWIDRRANRDQMRMHHMAETLSLLVAKAAAHFEEHIDPTQQHELPALQGLAPVVVAPFSNSTLRDWPVENYRALIVTLSQTRNVILVGRNEDAASLQTMVSAAREAGGGNIDCATDLNERQFNELLSSAALVISNNSGAGHVAAQLGRPTLGIFTASHLPELWGFQGPRVSMLMSTIECRGCGIDVVRRCPQRVRCKSDITAEHVLAEIEALAGHDNQQPTTIAV